MIQHVYVYCGNYGVFGVKCKYSFAQKVLKKSARRHSPKITKNKGLLKLSKNTSLCNTRWLKITLAI